ncbi:hypothetical protein Tco_0856185 [Tanacetum coccineum]
MTSPNKPTSKPSREVKMSVKPIWRKKPNLCNTSNVLNATSPMPKPLTPYHEPSQENNHFNQSLPNPYIKDTTTSPQVISHPPFPISLINSHVTHTQAPPQSVVSSSTSHLTHQLTWELVEHSEENSELGAREKKISMVDVDNDWKEILNRVTIMACNNSIRSILRRIVLAASVYIYGNEGIKLVSFKVKNSSQVANVSKEWQIPLNGNTDNEN